MRLVGAYEAVLCVARAIGTEKYRLFAERTEQFGDEKEPALLILVAKQAREDSGAVFTRKLDFEIFYGEEKMTNAKFYAFARDMEKALMPSFELGGRRVKPKNAFSELKKNIGRFEFSVEFADDDITESGDDISKMEELIYGFTDY